MEKVYETYKDSGLNYLGDIPSHWETVKLKYIGEAITGITYSPNDIVDDENGLLVLRSSNIQDGKLSLDNNVYVNKEIKEKYLTKIGDILLCSRNGSRNLIGKNILIDEKVANETWGAFMTIYRTQHSKFAYYFFNSPIFDALSSLFLSSTINQLTIGVINNFILALPPKQEQTQIAAYLDYHTSKIDALITKKETLIQKLQEQRQAVINEAVTKGLNKNVALKDSGIEWLGDIPAHWSASYLKRFSEKITDGAHHSPKTELEGKNYVSVKDVDEFGNVDLKGCKKISEDDFELLVRNGCQPEIGDVLLTKDGTIGRAAIVENNDFVILSSLGLIRPKKEILNEGYLRYFLISGLNVTQMYSMIAGAALTRLTIEKIKHLVITIPPLEEQNEIVSTLDNKIHQMDITIKEVKTSIQKLKDYRQSLISEAVTGKIDVREWQQPENKS
ncbi:restriction endonuclease subunit S [Tenacibaculum sp. M341]|uniref:restriction endonuclease subunit S n=1 Tax=Tenacibaculum sp. M341 TaxID=2530339 RepID=UPI001051D5C4|nr:restriction endonuclease subunit S [Tenacibaculum sp. M341]TCI85314.1 hypothetical protein EYW44_17220 [Tenacibaculum sp. M341]